MKQYLFIFGITLSLFAQESVGLSDQIQLDKLTEYSYPEWGYQNFRFNFSASGDYNSEPVKGKEETEYIYVNERFRFQLMPDYIFYTESDEQTINASFRATGNKQSNFSRNNTGYKFSELNNTVFLEGNYNLKNYTENNISYGFGVQSNYKFENRLRKSANFYRETTYNRLLEISIHSEIGAGRVRNVTPMLQALRLVERYQTITGKMLKTDDIAKLAELFQQRFAYTQNYDRSDKYFFKDLESEFPEIFKGRTVYETFYLQEVENEIIGSRHQGNEFTFGVNLNHGKASNDYLREEYDRFITDSWEVEENSDTKSENNVLGAYISANSYTNMSLYFQLGVQALFTYQKPLQESTSVNNRVSMQLSFDQVANIMDRLLLKNEIGFGFSSTSFEHDITQTQRRYFVNTSFNYYIEDHLSINLTGSGNIVNSSKTYRTWTGWFGVSYSLFRDIY